MKKYVYFVSYAHQFGWGNIEITQEMEMTEIQFIKSAQQMIENDFDGKDPIIISFQLLRTEDS